MSVPSIWSIVLISLAAGLVSGVAGFGYGLVALGAFALVMPIDQATVLVSAGALGAAGLNLWTVRRQVPWRETLVVLAPSLPMIILGVYLLTVLEEGVLRAGVALITLAGCVITIWCPKTAYVRHPFPWGYLAGLLGGLFGGTLGTGGPPIVLYALLRGWDKSQTKGLLAAYFVVGSAWRLALLVGQGVATADTLRLGLLVLVPSLAGTYLGTAIFGRMSTQVFRYTTMALLMALSARLLLP